MCRAHCSNDQYIAIDVLKNDLRRKHKEVTCKHREEQNEGETKKQREVWKNRLKT